MMSKMISCFLCGVGGYQTGSPEFENHLMHDHGVVLDDGLDFMNKLSEFKTVHLRVPDLNQKRRLKPSRAGVLCKKCEIPPAPSPAVPRPVPGPGRTVKEGRGGLMLMDDDGLPSLYGWTCTCALCHYTSGDDTTFWSHITKSHGVSWKDYKEQYGTCQTPLNGRDGMFCCEFCSDRVKHWPGNVKKHMLRKHKMTWEEFMEDWKTRNPNHGRQENKRKARADPGPEARKVSAATTLEEASADLTTAKTEEGAERAESKKKVKPLNIRDKRNTYCNECDLTLPTRIEFLAHCSQVHDVKFKGKLGQPLVIPTVTNSSSAVPDEDQRDQTVSSPDRKKARLSASVISSPNSKKDRDPVPCQYCGKEFSNYFNMERHIRQACKVGSHVSVKTVPAQCQHHLSFPATHHYFSPSL